ncbi:MULTISPECIES: type 1 glutamine amidotransferase domain-containing protein [unclassified Mycobacterium]|uniref:type 1 glutamine amidotransferase domain-containing protein n=1 Tax=unclassified Mycobacterium TaxID=2642494 RepID=UPI0007FF6FA4|nr:MULTISPECIES: type 1 glutamine amidotransferase domain-containing protein [unclassified Mycobacterium]OBG51626.1 thiamine biosynthesis protein ThiJ [Mycobacterium sp. E735]OBG66151.1 thiamine biosynthesis protein ThiJ [Mycobacterium sp. E188]OBG70699.1 thiamine biosynthesis protein ThiJ [Mycobacterium sp. E3305]OBH40746.1 thiamine biosynthesis protein ThiJ [Mycobacterium sp. E183]
MAKVLFVVTGASYWTLKDGTRHPTGYWAEEFAAPYRELTGSGHQVVVATPKGVVPHVDVMSLRPSMAGSEEIALELEEILRSAEEVRRPIELASARVDDYDAVYYPGGHGPMEDLWQDADSGRLLIAALASGKPLAIVCHAPVAMMATRRNGVSPFAGYKVTAFTNDEEDGVGLLEKARWTAEDELVKMGVDFSRGERWKPYTLKDRNLFTGQNPASAGPLAKEFMKELG